MVIEWAMYFALGFLSAGVLALALMSALWRRAVRLTTRRVETRLPADIEAVVAEKDMAAARFARDLRRLEMALADLRRQNAEERIEVGRQRVALDVMRQARDGETARVEAGLAREVALAEEIAERDRRLAERAEELSEAQRRIDELEADVGEHVSSIAGLERDIEDRDVEVATRKTEIGALMVQIEAARERSAEQLRRVDDLTTEKGRAETLAAQERDRADRLDKRIERLVADVADREDVADRRQRELERAREALTMANARIALLGNRAGETAQPGDNLLRSLDLLETRNRDLEARLTASEQEATRLRAGGAAAGEVTREGLRDQIAGLAAEMALITGALEGPGSPIDRIVAGAASGTGGQPTLAERIRVLRAAAGGGAAAK